jgi:pyruvate formate lyase activating enzyme
MKEAMFYKKLGENLVKCNLCNHRCRIADGKRGICGVRENRNGTLYSLVYGRLVATHVDPIEKKPLYHFLPGTKSYSIATVGCNFKCKNCQNWEISQSPKPEKPIIGGDVPAEKTVEAAERTGCASIAYTYTEPVIFMEYAYDTSQIAVEKGIKNVFVTNGYITEEALKKISPYLHAANIDLKSFSDEFYRNNCGASVEPVLKAIELHKKYGIWIEITTLVIPSLNDSAENFSQIADFLKDLGTEIPWHISRFYPSYYLIDLPPTPIKTLRKARKIGIDAGLHHVYIGNTPGEGENTHCYTCGEKLIDRHGYIINKVEIVDSRCPKCDAKIEGIW